MFVYYRVHSISGSIISSLSLSLSLTPPHSLFINKARQPAAFPSPLHSLLSTINIQNSGLASITSISLPLSPDTRQQQHLYIQMRAGRHLHIYDYYHESPDRGPSSAWLIVQALLSNILPLRDEFDFAVITSDNRHSVTRIHNNVTFTYATDTDYYHHVCPDFSFHAWYAVHISDYDKLCDELHEAGNVTSPTQEAKIGWIGALLVPQRKALFDLGRQHSYILDIIDVNWTHSDSASHAASDKYLSLPEQVRRWKYLIDVQGSGWSARLKMLFHSGRVVFIVDRHAYKEWYFQYLVPWVHYVPVRWDLSDLLENYARVEADSELQLSIQKAGMEFAMKHLTRQAALERWQQLLVGNFGVVE